MQANQSIPELLKALDQPHLLSAYESASELHRKEFEAQIHKLNQTYPGGLKEYQSRALHLLKNSQEGINPYEEYNVGKPNGLTIKLEDIEEVKKHETIGLNEMGSVAFVLVAGGLGQRLGYPGIKIGIPMDLLTLKPFIQYYIEYILTFQKRYCSAGEVIPFAIMTSDDTHTATLALLQANQYFGMPQTQITLIKQEKVPAMINNSAHFALAPPLLIETKPHGHGDVHTLIYMAGLHQKWEKQGKKWIVVFQDTNPLSMRSAPLLVGISKQRDLQFNSLCVPRKLGEAVGAICTLQHKTTKKILTVNVEYNQLEALFKEQGGQKTDSQGFCYFPGNINCFCISIPSYVKILNRSKGLIAEFINPKYADATKTAFKSSTRLECLMQDYPKLLDNCDRVGFVNVPKGYCFTAVKNDLKSGNDKIKQGISGETAGSCEADVYKNNRDLLRLAGAKIEESQPVIAGGASLSLFPMIVIAPSFATCLTELLPKVKKVNITKHSSLIIASDCVLEDVNIDGHHQIKESGSITVNQANKDYRKVEDIKKEEKQPYLQIRGYKLKQKTE